MIRISAQVQFDELDTVRRREVTKECPHDERTPTALQCIDELLHEIGAATGLSTADLLHELTKHDSMWQVRHAR